MTSEPLNSREGLIDTMVAVLLLSTLTLLVVRRDSPACASWDSLQLRVRNVYCTALAQMVLMKAFPTCQNYRDATEGPVQLIATRPFYVSRFAFCRRD